MDAKALADLTIAAVKQHIAGREAVVIEQLKVEFDAKVKQVQESFSVIKGEKGESGKDGIDGKDGERGQDGKDGISPSADEVAKSMEGIFSKWVLDFERKADLVLEKAIDRIPKPKDGKDALELSDFNLELLEDGRTVKMSLVRGDEIKEKTVKLATILDKGVYRDDATYEKGDSVSYGGSAYICQVDNPDGKPAASKDWRLQVKRGRDGRESVKVEKPTVYKLGGKNGAAS
jgi:hypothetical protein